jgi:Ni/Fe-hydrogenase 1 B-type cytochrome subunit
MSAPTLPNAASTAELTGVDEAAVAKSSRSGVYVYEAPVRLWHWVNALAVTVLAVTGYFIASPLPSMPGEASDHYLMGTIRFAHFAAGYVLAIGLLGRAYWAFIGNHHARELFSVPLLSPAYWKEVGVMAAWYGFVRPRPNQYIGHNPLARLAMFFGYLLPVVFMVVTGFALYGEGTQAGSWAHNLFTSWVIPLFGSSQDVHTWHHLTMWVLVIFAITHLYTAIREEIMGRQSMVSTMISGYRTFKD